MPFQEDIIVNVKYREGKPIKITETIKDIESMGDRLKTTTRTFINGQLATKKFANVTRRFRMELLSVMFAGMQLKKTMENLMRPAFDAVGVFEIWGDFLAVVFLPAAFWLLDIVLGLWDAFDRLPEPIKKLIPIFALIGAVVGGGLFLFGQLGMTINGLKMAFPSLMAGLGGLTPILGAVFMAVGILIAVFIAMDAALKALGMPGLWEGVTQGIQNLGNIIQWLGFLAKEKFKMFRWDVEMTIDNIKRWFATLPENIRNVMVNFVNFVAQGITNVVNWFRGLPNSIVNAITSFAYRLIEVGRNMINWIVQGIQSAIAGIGGFVGGILRGIGERVGGFFAGIGMQKGGIVTRPTPALIGERGPEAVIPLDKLGSSISIQNPIINISSMIGKESTELIVREIIEKLGLGLTRVG